jgi:hypothetical protein
MLHIANRSAMGLTDAVGAVNRSLLAGPTLHYRRISIQITLTLQLRPTAIRNRTQRRALLPTGQLGSPTPTAHEGTGDAE